MKHLRIRKAKRMWMVFKIGKRRLIEVTFAGRIAGEVEATKSLLAYQQDVLTDQVKVTLETK